MWYVLNILPGYSPWSHKLSEQNYTFTLLQCWIITFIVVQDSRLIRVWWNLNFVDKIGLCWTKGFSTDISSTYHVFFYKYSILFQIYRLSATIVMAYWLQKSTKQNDSSILYQSFLDVSIICKYCVLFFFVLTVSKYFDFVTRASEKTRKYDGKRF